ncbi:uncharacterized protein Z520_02882 [Fonsecaea multimorphosa CBS 102226]|uniref:Uncharacterized protein n=1 Tax=Fonsecaea multimorphosa CBS 102226 TaxID=1442371 RepID=A0A0D2KDL8_9EURO|nr:uncharacterized protein Z520_02882 [Fonsecaea multimorphosa CBS 102226]KIY01330.1 hypothetical protein Z520_02882 [Fonsecaea multimorphosa CBS 102226]OAL28607.1 hypothetical protein AYO22_02801 [Fonsecaea multimorphosa]
MVSVHSNKNNRGLTRPLEPSDQSPPAPPCVTPASVTDTDDKFQVRKFFPNPGRSAWKQVFSARHEKMCKTPQPPHPDGHISPIFKKSNFSRLDAIRGLEKPLETWLDPRYTIDDEFYGRIRPALVLATRFCKYTSEFFNILVFGEFELEGRILKYDRFTELELGSESFPAMMDNLTNMQFFTGYHDNNHDRHADTYASTHFGTHPKNCTPRMTTTAVQLNNKFTTFFTHVHYYSFADEVKNVMTVSLAITLMHELVHVWYTLRRMEVARFGHLELCKLMQKEPYFFGNEKWNELGLSWEHFAFRGMPQLNTSGKGGYARAKSLRLTPLLNGTDKNDEVIVDSEIVRALLDQECWELYERLLIGDLAAGYMSIRGMGILERMNMVVALREFYNETGRLPLSAELLRATGQHFRKQQRPKSMSIDAEITKITTKLQTLSLDPEMSEITTKLHSLSIHTKTTEITTKRQALSIHTKKTEITTKLQKQSTDAKISEVTNVLQTLSTNTKKTEIKTKPQTLSTETKRTEIVTMLQENCGFSSPGPIWAEECMNYALEWQFLHEEAISDPEYLAGRARNQERIENARLGRSHRREGKRWSKRRDEQEPALYKW